MDGSNGFEVRELLGGGESLLWSGRPRRGMVLHASDWPSIGMGVFMVLFSLFWMGIAIRAAGPFFLFGSIFLAVGLYIAGGAQWVDARRRARTVYAVTDRRVIIASDFFGRRVTSLDLESLTNVSLRQAGGHGTILFGAENSLARWAYGPFMSASVPRFELGDDLMRAYEAVTSALHRRRSGG